MKEVKALRANPELLQTDNAELVPHAHDPGELEMSDLEEAGALPKEASE